MGGITAQVMAESETLKPGWKRVKFGDVVKLSKARCSDPEAAGIERYVGLEHIDSDDLRIRRWGLVEEGTTFTTLFKPGQVLFGKRRAYLRKVAVADFQGVCSGDIYVFESANPKVLLPELLPFICQTDRFFDYAIGTSAGSLSPRTNWKSLVNFEFALPPLEEQEKFLKILLATERSIEELALLKDRLAKVRQSTSIEYFSHNKIDYFGSIAQTIENISIQKMSDACSLIRDGTHLPPKRVQDGPWLLGVTNLVNGCLVLSDSDTKVSEGFYIEIHKKWKPMPGDVLLAIVGMQVFLARGDDKKC
jgi:type I restriction enzyme S subunit